MSLLRLNYLTKIYLGKILNLETCLVESRTKCFSLKTTLLNVIFYVVLVISLEVTPAFDLLNMIMLVTSVHFSWQNKFVTCYRLLQQMNLGYIYGILEC